MIKTAIKKTAAGTDLSRQETVEVFTSIMNGSATPAQIAALLTAMKIKGETAEEITGAAMVMRKFAVPIKVSRECFIDTCGTGGSGKHKGNISTLAALVVSGAGVTVAKHGNRSATGRSGSADLLEQLGVNINADPKTVEKCINEIGIGFMFAPKFHGAMKYAGGPRKEIGIRTIFNILGPLTNPAGATAQLLGTFCEELTATLALVLKNLGTRRAMVVHGGDGVDEVSITAETAVQELKDGKISAYRINPGQFGFKPAGLSALQVTGPEESRDIARELLDGRHSAVRDSVVFNAAAALYVAGAADSIKEAIPLAEASIDEKRAAKKLSELIRYTNEVTA